MKKIIIGSTAINHWFEDFNREPNDLDYAVSEEVKSGEKTIEFLYNPIIFKYIQEGETILRPDLLYTLKLSHLTHDINWRKHMYDANFLARKGCRVNQELLDELRVFWKEYLPKVRRSDLKMSKEDFFNNAVNNDVMEHDDLHLLINPSPIYQKVLKDGCEVDLEESKFHALTYEEKLDFVREEVWVMAWERYKHRPWYHAYSMMLEKFIKQHIPLFALEFAVKNYHILTKPNTNHIKTINDGLKRNQSVLI